MKATMAKGLEIKQKATSQASPVAPYRLQMGKKWVLHYAGTREGWAYYLRNLKSVLETGYDLREEDE